MAASSGAKSRATMSLAGVDDDSKIMRLKILTMGSQGVGKSCIVKRYCEGRFVPKYICTIGIDFGVKPVKVNGKEVRVNFWDVSGHRALVDVRNEFYRDAEGAAVVFDVTRKESFDQLDAWLKEARESGASRRMPCVLCANHVDLTGGAERAVTEEQGRRWAADHGMSYFETSAETGQGVSEALESLFDAALRAKTAKSGGSTAPPASVSSGAGKGSSGGGGASGGGWRRR